MEPKPLSPDIEIIKEGVICSFCGKEDPSFAGRGPGVFICDTCIDNAKKDLDKQREENGDPQINLISKPSEIKEYLDKFVIGHESPKKTISVAAYDYLRWKEKGKNYIDHIFMMGETGTGKTLLAETLAKKLKIPFADVNMKEFTEAGFVGKDVDYILYMLYKQSGSDLKKLEQLGGIVYLDEIDKIASRPGSSKEGVNSIGVQESLLKMIGGHNVDVFDYSKSYGQRPIIGQIDTSKILFFVGGAFDGIEDIVARELGVAKGIEEKETRNRIGFESAKDKKMSTKELRAMVKPKHVISYGMISQFLGRFSTLVVLDDLTKAEYRRILTEPDGNLVEVYKDKFSGYGNGIGLNFTDEALDMLAEHAEKSPFHARAIKTMLKELFTEDIYKISNSTKKGNFTVDAEYVRKHIN